MHGIGRQLRTCRSDPGEGNHLMNRVATVRSRTRGRRGRRSRRKNWLSTSNQGVNLYKRLQMGIRGNCKTSAQEGKGMEDSSVEEIRDEILRNRRGSEERFTKLGGEESLSIDVTRKREHKKNRKS